MSSSAFDMSSLKEAVKEEAKEDEGDDEDETADRCLLKKTSGSK